MEKITRLRLEEILKDLKSQLASVEGDELARIMTRIEGIERALEGSMPEPDGPGGPVSEASRRAAGGGPLNKER